MPPRLRGKWALGITPRNFTWFMKDKLAVCERPGGYGDNHRRVRRQEEIETRTKVVAHNESVDDKIIGIMGGYIRWSGMVDDPSTVINLTERIAKRQLDPFAREVILMAHELH